MKYCLAPMEGITTYIYRGIFARHFTPPDVFYTPFLSPCRDSLFSAREMTEILPADNAGLHVIPQLMVKDTGLCLEAIHFLADLGYPEVNLNLGCPSGVVLRKGKGAGLLSDPGKLDHFLEEICSGSELPVSVKTRLGLHSPEEWPALLDVFRRYPLKEMILHPRVRDEFYQGDLHMTEFRMALNELSCPVIYNGDLHSPSEIRRISDADPGISGVMIGRAWIAHPDLLDPEPASREKLAAFDRELEDAYRELLPSEHSVLVKMKRIFSYRLEDACISREMRVQVMQAEDLEEFHRAADKVCSAIEQASYDLPVCL